MEIQAMAEQCIANSKAWFPSTHAPTTLTATEHAVQHCTLGLGGEAGEVTNKVKKWLGYSDQGHPRDLEWLRVNVGPELIDVIIYALNLCQIIDVDVDQVYDQVRADNLARFGKKES